MCNVEHDWDLMNDCRLGKHYKLYVGIIGHRWYLKVESITKRYVGIYYIEHPWDL